MTRFDVAVIGGGPAGLAAAIAAAGQGARTALFDEGAEPGGQRRYRIGPEKGLTPDAMAKLAKEVREAGVALFPSSVVWGVYPGFTLGVSGPGLSCEVHAERLILATGTTELAMAFPGSDLPGVMTGRGLLRMLHLHRVWPGGKRIAIVGEDQLADEVARCVELAGGIVTARIAANPTVVGSDGVVSHIVTERGAIDTELVAICAGERPDIGLALMLETDTGFSPHLGGFTIRVDRALTTSIDGLYACGGAAGTGTVDEHLAEGRLAGLSAAESLGQVSELELEDAVSAHSMRFPARVADQAAVSTGWTQHFVESVYAAGDS